MHIKKYKQLTQEQRYHIYALHKIWQNQKLIALELKVHKSTISRELNRNWGLKGYRPQQAHKLALNRRYNSAKTVKMTDKLKNIIKEKMTEFQWSPEQISGCIVKHLKVKLSHESIYQYIFENKTQEGNLFKNLRQGHKKYKKRYGDWKADTIIGLNHKGDIVTITESKSQFVLMKKLT